MKYEFTFAETSKIFAQVDKVIKTAARFSELSEEYNEFDATFEDEFAKYGYTFFHAPQELHDMFEKKLALSKERDKAERAAYKAIKDFGTMIEIGTNYCDIIEEKVKQYINSDYRFDAPAMVERVKHLALDASRRIKFNA